jgi:hypothetical protein
MHCEKAIKASPDTTKQMVNTTWALYLTNALPINGNATIKARDISVNDQIVVLFRYSVVQNYSHDRQEWHPFSPLLLNCSNQFP